MPRNPSAIKRKIKIKHIWICLCVNFTALFYIVKKRNTDNGVKHSQINRIMCRICLFKKWKKLCCCLFSHYLFNDLFTFFFCHMVSVKWHRCKCEELAKYTSNHKCNITAFLTKTYIAWIAHIKFIRDRGSAAIFSLCLKCWTHL